MEPSFSPGDIVVLKSGGPEMTVESIDPQLGVRCKWFAGKTLHAGNFKPETLKRGITGVNIILEQPPQ